MSCEIDDIIREILNSTPDRYSGFQSSTPQTKKVNEVNIIDLKGKRFKFTGKFEMTESNGSVSFKAIKD